MILCVYRFFREGFPYPCLEFVLMSKIRFSSGGENAKNTNTNIGGQQCSAVAVIRV